MTTVEPTAPSYSLGEWRALSLSNLLKTLLPEEWNYAHVVSKLDLVNMCGTCCCAAGWLPRIDPANWRWMTFDGYQGVVLKGFTYPTAQLHRMLSEYFDMTESDATNIFYFAANLISPSRRTFGVTVSPLHVAALLDHWVASTQRPNRLDGVTVDFKTAEIKTNNNPQGA